MSDSLWRQPGSSIEYWSGLPSPSPGDLPHPGIEPVSPALQAESLPAEPSGKMKMYLSQISQLIFMISTYWFSDFYQDFNDPPPFYAKKQLAQQYCQTFTACLGLSDTFFYLILTIKLCNTAILQKRNSLEKLTKSQSQKLAGLESELNSLTPKFMLFPFPYPTYNSFLWLVIPAQCMKFTYEVYAAAAAKSLQPCLTLCDPIDGSPPESPVPGILQARTLEWVAISFSNA